MRVIAGIVILCVLLIGVCAAAIHQFDDRELFVSPPDAVSEGFMREVTMRRFDRSAGYLANSDTPQGEMRILADSIEQRIGSVNDVEAETISRTDSEALIDVRLTSAKSVDSLALKAVWDGKEWKVATLP